MPYRSTSSARTVGVQSLQYARHDRFGGEAEPLEQVFRRRGGAEAVEADLEPRAANMALPAQGRAGLDRDQQRPVGNDIAAIAFVLSVEQLEARHGDDVGADPLPFERLGHLD